MEEQHSESEKSAAIKALEEIKETFAKQLEEAQAQQVVAVRTIVWLLTESRWWANHYATRLVRESPYPEIIDAQPSWLEYH